MFRSALTHAGGTEGYGRKARKPIRALLRDTRKAANRPERALSGPSAYAQRALDLVMSFEDRPGP